jgi:photosystem II stability/assembly factor-like uncharacterized protein
VVKRLLVAVAVVLIGRVELLAQPDASPQEMLQDAELTAVTFVDADRGWAVGDRGVIWHTADGGRSWKLQQSGVTCRLEAIQFLDADNGIAVGGWTQPYTHETHGVVLRCRRRRSWQNTSDLTLPGLKHVRLFDARAGWALGDGSPLHPSGVFKTADGGAAGRRCPRAKQSAGSRATFAIRPAAVAGFGGTLGLVTSRKSGRRTHRTSARGACSGWCSPGKSAAGLSGPGGLC